MPALFPVKDRISEESAKTALFGKQSCHKQEKRREEERRIVSMSRRPSFDLVAWEKWLAYEQGDAIYTKSSSA